MITAHAATFNEKAFNDTELWKSSLANGKEIIDFDRQTSQSVTVEHLTKHIAYV